MIPPQLYQPLAWGIGVYLCLALFVFLALRNAPIVEEPVAAIQQGDLWMSRRNVVCQLVSQAAIPDKLHEMARRCSDTYDPEFWRAVGLTNLQPHEPREIAFDAFMTGAREALRMNHAELVEENCELHSRLIELMTRYGVTACPTCNALGVDVDSENLDDCETCHGEGWVKA